MTNNNQFTVVIENVIDNYFQESNNPQFLKTVGFGDSGGVDTCTRVKITVYHVKERMTGTVGILL